MVSTFSFLLLNITAGTDTLMTSTSRTENGTRIESATVSSEDDTAGEDGTGEDGTGGREGNCGSETITFITETQNEGSNHSQSTVPVHST